MELILISESKLKIMLTADDMESYDISNEQMSYEVKTTRDGFEKILDVAKEKTGFDSASSKLLIQVYPSRNGGCEVYVIRDGEVKSCQSAKEKSGPPKKKKEVCVYLFDGIDGMLKVCDVLLKCGYKNESSVYYEQLSGKTRYYLVLQEEVPYSSQNRKRKSLSKSDLANEYGKRLGGREILMYIEEHADRLIERNAVKTVSGLV